MLLKWSMLKSLKERELQIFEALNIFTFLNTSLV